MEGRYIITLIFKKASAVFLAFACFYLIIFNRETVRDSVMETMLFCFKNLVPNLFPLMVISSVFCRINLFNTFFGKKESSILGNCRNTANVVINSWICGYLLGPKYLCSEKSDYDKTPLIFLTTNAGIGFTVLYVGGVIWQSISYGIYLFFVQIFSSVLIFSLLKKEVNKGICIKQEPLITAVCSSVQSSTKSVLDMCGFTVFISVMRDVINNMFPCHIFNQILSAISEISTGITVAATCADSSISGFFVGFILGFGGLAIYFQTLSVCNGANVKKCKLLALKILQGIFCGILSSVFVFVFNLTPSKTVGLMPDLEFNAAISVINGIFIFCTMLFAKKALKRKFLY